MVPEGINPKVHKMFITAEKQEPSTSRMLSKERRSSSLQHKSALFSCVTGKRIMMFPAHPTPLTGAWGSAGSLCQLGHCSGLLQPSAFPGHPHSSVLAYPGPQSGLCSPFPTESLTEGQELQLQTEEAGVHPRIPESRTGLGRKGP